MSKLISEQLNEKLPQINPGDTLRVHQKIKEGDKERIQIFEGVVIAAKHGKGISGTITVRKIVDGVGVERIFPLHSPFISKMEVVASSKVRRSKLYYLRQVKGKKARLKKKEFAHVIAEEPMPEPVAAPEESKPEQPTTEPAQPESASKSIEAK